MDNIHEPNIPDRFEDMAGDVNTQETIIDEYDPGVELECRHQPVDHCQIRFDWVHPEDEEEDIEVEDNDVKMTLQETGNRERCDLLVELLSIPGGQRIFDETFQSSSDDPKKKNENVHISNALYAKRLKENNYSLNVHYCHSKRTPGKGRLYASNKNGRGTAGQQMLRRSVRVFLQCNSYCNDYYDYDMVAAWPSILWMLCEKHDLECTLLKKFVELCHAGRRAEFLHETQMTKLLFNKALNTDHWKERLTRAQKKCKKLMSLFSEIMINKTKLAEIYGPGGVIGGFKSNPAKPNNRVSTLITIVLQEFENQELQRAIAVVRRIFHFDFMGPSGYDGFQLKQKLEQRDIAQMNNKYIQWIQKPNISYVDMSSFKAKIKKAQESITNWTVPAEMYTHEVDGQPRVRELCPALCHRNDQHMLSDDMNVGKRYPIKLMLRDEMGLGKTYQLSILVLRQFTERNDDWLSLMTELGLTDKTNVRAAADDCDQRGFPFMGVDVLIIYHRILLIDSTTTKYWRKLGFQLYSDQEGVIFDTGGRWIACIDSLHRFHHVNNYHLAAVDEFTETIQSMTNLKTKTVGSGKWEVHYKLQTLLKESESVVLMSAQADRIEKEYLDEIGVDVHWQMNAAKPLKELKYEFSHFEDKVHEFKPIFDALDSDKKIVIPCSENCDLQTVLSLLQKKYPHKKFLAIFGKGLSDEERKRRVRLAENEPFDAILFTSSMDCGVSIELKRRIVNSLHQHEHAYDLIIFRLNVRSINANQVMQMILRVRNLNDKKIIFICDRLVKDWDHLPGYDYNLLKDDNNMAIKNLPTGCAPVVTGYNNLTEVRRATYLSDGIKDDVFYWMSPTRNTWYKWIKRVATAEVTKDEMKRFILRPAGIEEWLGTAEGCSPSSLRELVTNADSPFIKMVLEVDYKKAMPLVNLIINIELNQHNLKRNMVAQITRIIKLQDASVTHTIHEQINEDEQTRNLRKQEIEEQLKKKKKESQDIVLADILPIEELRIIKKKTNRETKEKNSLFLFYLRATYGNETIKKKRGEIYNVHKILKWIKIKSTMQKIQLKEYDENKIIDNIMSYLPELETLALTNRNNQERMRILCSLMDPKAGFANPENLFGETREQFQSSIDAKGRHLKSEMFGLCNLMCKGFQFKDPCDSSERQPGEDFNKDEVTKHFMAYKQLKNAKMVTVIPHDILCAATQILKSNWGIGPTRSNPKKPVYHIARSKAAEHWGDITYDKYIHYKTQVELLKNDNTTFDYESNLYDDDIVFASESNENDENSLAKRQRTL